LFVELLSLVAISSSNILAKKEQDFDMIVMTSKVKPLSLTIRGRNHHCMTHFISIKSYTPTTTVRLTDRLDRYIGSYQYIAIQLARVRRIMLEMDIEAEEGNGFHTLHRSV
jgi:hypothetical protein